MSEEGGLFKEEVLHLTCFKITFSDEVFLQVRFARQSFEVVLGKEASESFWRELVLFDRGSEVLSLAEEGILFALMDLIYLYCLSSSCVSLETY